MGKKMRRITMVIVTIIVAVTSIAVLFETFSATQTRILSLPEMEYQLNDALNNNPFQEIRKNLDTNLVYLQNVDINTNRSSVSPK